MMAESGSKPKKEKSDLQLEDDARNYDVSVINESTSTANGYQKTSTTVYLRSVQSNSVVKTITVRRSVSVSSSYLRGRLPISDQMEHDLGAAARSMQYDIPAPLGRQSISSEQVSLPAKMDNAYNPANQSHAFGPIKRQSIE